MKRCDLSPPVRAPVRSRSGRRHLISAPSFQQPYSFRQLALGSISESPVRIIFVRHTLERGPLTVMLLHLFGAGTGMGQMKHDAGPFASATVRDQLGHSALVNADAMTHERLVVTSGALPQALAGKRKLPSAQRMIWNLSPVAQRIGQADV